MFKAVFYFGFFFFFQAEDGIRDYKVTGVQTCALPICGRGLSQTIAGFRQMNIPAAATVTAACIECFGGLAMIVGFLARPVALGLIVVMLVAIKKVHARHGFFLNWSLAQGKGHGFEVNLALIAMALSIVIGGAGVLSIDWLIAPLGGVGGGAAR